MLKSIANLKFTAIGLIFAFFFNSLGPIPVAQAVPIYSVEGEFHLPAPGILVHLSPEFNPPILKGIKVHPDNPFRFDFILDKGSSPLFYKEGNEGSSLKQEATKLIKYFLASLTIPEKDLWVNLSPYEKNSIVPESFGQTEMGRDLLAEDYMLKQITASLIYPEGEVGKKFWKRIYEEAAKKFGTTNIPVNTFNKVWIVPEKAVVYENAKAGTAYVVESKLKVMLEQDYLALEKNQRQPTERLPGDMFPAKRGTCPQADCQAGKGLRVKAPQGTNLTQSNDVNALGSQVVREIVIPELTKEVNEDKNFTQLRQVYNSLILATWYKNKIKDSILAQVYEDKKKIAGVEYKNSVIASPKGEAISKRINSTDVEFIYQRYLQAFKKGVFNYIKEEASSIPGLPGKEQGIFPRKYFSGGEDMTHLGDLAMTITHNIDRSQLTRINNFDLISMHADAAMPTEKPKKTIAEAKGELISIIEDLTDFNQRDIVPDLTGEILGQTNTNGALYLGFTGGFELNLPVLGFAGKEAKGWGIKVKHAGVNNGIYELNLEMTKYGHKSIPKILQARRFIRTIRNRIGETKQILDLSGQLAIKEGIMDLVTKPEDFDWEANRNQLPNLDGLMIDITDKLGMTSFSPFSYYRAFYWSILGLHEEGWLARVKESGVKNGVYEFTVEFTKEGEMPKTRVFQIGHFTRMLLGIGKNEGKKPEKVLDIDDKLAIRGLKQIMLKLKDNDWQADADTLPDIRGMSIGTTSAVGTIGIDFEGYYFYWTILGFTEEGWRGIVTDGRVRDGAYEFTVELRKKYQRPITKVFRIGGVEKTKGVLDIVPVERKETQSWSGTEAQKERLSNFIVGITHELKPPDAGFITQEIRNFSRQRRAFFISDNNGELSLSNFEGKQVIFHGLWPNTSYRLIPVWEDGSGLRIHARDEDGNKRVFAIDELVPKVFSALEDIRDPQGNWHFPKYPFWDWEDKSFIDMPEKLREIQGINDLPVWFRIGKLETKERYLAEINRSARIQRSNAGELQRLELSLRAAESFSTKTKKYLEDPYNSALDPEIFTEISIFLAEGEEYVTLRVAGQDIKIENSEQRNRLMGVLLDWTFWNLAGLHPNNGEGKILAAVYLSSHLDGMKSVAQREIASNSDRGVFLKAFEDNPEVQDAYEKVARAAYQWKFYDYLYQVNFRPGAGGINNYLDNTLPFHYIKIGISTPLGKKLQETNFLADFANEGLLRFMPFRLLKANGSMNPVQQINLLMNLVATRNQYQLTPWHVHLIYEALSAAKFQGLGRQADAIWKEFRQRLMDRKMVRRDTFMTASPTGSIGSNSNQKDAAMVSPEVYSLMELRPFVRSSIGGEIYRFVVNDSSGMTYGQIRSVLKIFNVPEDHDIWYDSKAWKLLQPGMRIVKGNDFAFGFREKNVEIIHAIERWKERSQKTIMVIEDNPYEKEQVKRKLAEMGYNVVIADDGLVAWRELQSISIDGVISDLNMGSIHGDILLGWLRQGPRFFRIPFILRADVQSGLSKIIVTQYSGTNKSVSKRTSLNTLVNITDKLVLTNPERKRTDEAMLGGGYSATLNRTNMTRGGIDFNPDKMNLQVRMDSRWNLPPNVSVGGGNDSGGIKFHIDPAMLRQLQNAPGFTPVIINIQPMMDLRAFLGLSEIAQTSPKLSS